MKIPRCLIKKREPVETKHFNDSKHFIEYSNNMNDIYNKQELQQTVFNYSHKY